MSEATRLIESLMIRKGDFFTVTRWHKFDIRACVGYCFECLVVDYPFIRARCYETQDTPVITLCLDDVEIQPLKAEFVTSVIQELNRKR